MTTINFVPADTGTYYDVEARGYARVCGTHSNGVHVNVDRYRDGRYVLQVVRQQPDPHSAGVLCDELARVEWRHTEPHLVMDGAEIVARCASEIEASEIAIGIGATVATIQPA